MATRTRSKTKTASSRKTSSARKKTTAASAGARATAAREQGIAAGEAAAAAATSEIPAAVASIILNPGEAATSLNSVPKDEGGLPADVLAGIRSTVDSARGAAALGQPGQVGHGVGTAFDDTPTTDEEREANEQAYRERVS